MVTTTTMNSFAYWLPAPCREDAKMVKKSVEGLGAISSSSTKTTTTAAAASAGRRRAKTTAANKRSCRGGLHRSAGGRGLFEKSSRRRRGHLPSLPSLGTLPRILPKPWRRQELKWGAFDYGQTQNFWTCSRGCLQPGCLCHELLGARTSVLTRRWSRRR